MLILKNFNIAGTSYMHVGCVETLRHFQIHYAAIIYTGIFPPTIVLSIFHVIYLISLSGNGIIMMIIDNLPAQLPREATDYFGSRLLPFITDLVSF